MRKLAHKLENFSQLNIFFCSKNVKEIKMYFKIYFHSGVFQGRYSRKVKAGLPNL